MLYAEFRGMTLDALAEKTGIPGNEWSRYFNGRKGIGEMRLKRAGDKLSLESPELLRFINRKREEKALEKALRTGCKPLDSLVEEVSSMSEALLSPLGQD
jgi:transcriptional regulator with XRE-family HTH domain